MVYFFGVFSSVLSQLASCFLTLHQPFFGSYSLDLAETWTSFEKKQLGAYKRWTKNTGMKDEYSVFDKNQQFDARFK